MITFAAPALLWALPLASAPVLWHLFMKPRRRAVAFPSLMFFLRAEPRLEGRRKLREWIILALRCLIIALVVAALAGPRLPAIGGGGPTALALVIDTSASMAAPGGDGRPLVRLAAESAAALIAQLGAGGRVVIVPTAPDPAVALPARPSSDRAALTAALDRITASEAAGDPAAALARAGAALADDDAPDREIRILSDLQAGEWDRAVRLPPLPPGVRVTVHPLTPRAGGGGVDVVRVVPPPGRSIAGRPARCLIELANRTSADAQVTVRVAAADGGEEQSEAKVAAGATRALPVLLHPTAPGPAWAMLRLEGAAVGSAARAGLAVQAHGRIAALLLGEAAAFGPLPLALAPDGSGALSGIVPQLVTAAQLPAAITTSRPSLVVATWELLTALTDDALPAWINAGGTLLILPGADGVAPPAGIPAWVGCHPAGGVRATTPLTTVLPDAAAACWEHVRDAAGAVEVRLRVSRAWPLDPAAGTRTALALADGRPLILERVVGRGLVVACGLAFHPGWSDLPLKGWSLALVQGLALRDAPGARTFDLVAGQGLPAAPGDQAVVRLRALAGGPLDWSGPRAELPALVRAGVYQLEGAGPEPVVIAVRAAPDEGVPRYADPGRAALFAGLEARVEPLTDAAGAAASWRAARRGWDLAAWLVALALVCWLAEGLLGAQASACRGNEAYRQQAEACAPRGRT